MDSELVAGGETQRVFENVLFAFIWLFAAAVVISIPQRASPFSASVIGPDDWAAASDGLHQMMSDDLPTVSIQSVTESLVEGTGPIRHRLLADPAPSDDLEITVTASQTEQSAWRSSGDSQTVVVEIPSAVNEADFEIAIRNLLNIDGEGSVELKIVEGAGAYEIGDGTQGGAWVNDGPRGGALLS